MTMKNATWVLAGVLFATSATTAQALEKPKFDAGISLLGALDSTKTATHNSTGYNLQVGAEWAIQENLAFRAGFGLNSLPGSNHQGVLSGTEGEAVPTPTSGKFSLRSYQASGDFLFATGVKNLRWVFGLSLNRYSYSLSVDDGFANPMGYVGGQAFAPSHSFTAIHGTKFGARLGVEYQFMPNLSANMIFQQTELGSQGADSHQLNLNPAWLQLGVKYHF